MCVVTSPSSNTPFRDKNKIVRTQVPSKQYLIELDWNVTITFSRTKLTSYYIKKKSYERLKIFFILCRYKLNLTH